MLVQHQQHTENDKDWWKQNSFSVHSYEVLEFIAHGGKINLNWTELESLSINIYFLCFSCNVQLQYA